MERPLSGGAPSVRKNRYELARAERDPAGPDLPAVAASGGGVFKGRSLHSAYALFASDREPPAMTRSLLDAFWRAAAYCLHPKVILLSLAPLAIVGGGVALLGYYFWEPAVDAVAAALNEWSLLSAFFAWLASVGAGGFQVTFAPLVIVALAVPVCVVASLVLVAWLMTPAMVRLVELRRFVRLERREGGGFLQSLAWSLGCTVVAAVALVASIPLWFIPPLVLVVPPVIWGWLTYRVFSFDVLALHASREERRQLMAAHRWPLFGMGVLTGYLGAAPSLLWAVSALTVVLAPFLILVSIWLYTLVFAFSSLWFAHYLLAALRDLRAAEVPGAAAALPPPTETLRLPPSAAQGGITA